MQPTPQPAAVISLAHRRALAAPRQDPTRLLEAVDSAGSLMIRADDRPARIVAATLAAFGFLVIEEIDAEGEARRIRGRETRSAAPGHPWRVTRVRAASFPAGAIEAG